MPNNNNKKKLGWTEVCSTNSYIHANPDAPLKCWTFLRMLLKEKMVSSSNVNRTGLIVNFIMELGWERCELLLHFQV